MARNQKVQTITGDTTVTIPAGVTRVRATSFKQNTPFFGPAQGRLFVIDGLGNAYGNGFQPAGELGIGTVTPTSVPTLVSGGLTFRKLVGGSFNVAANGSVFGLTSTGKLYGWGSNAVGPLGDGTVLAKSVPTAVLGGLFFHQICSNYDGGASLIGLTSGGKAYAMGGNLYGELGLGDLIPRSSPVAVSGGLYFSRIWAGWDCYYGQVPGGALYAWGQGAFGKIGDGAPELNRSAPTLVAGGYTFAKFVVSRNHAAFGILADGTAYGFGANGFGELGVGDAVNRSSPTLVSGGLKFHQIATGINGETFGITTDGKLYGWGLNTDGQLGDGTVVSKSSPTLVVGLSGLKISRVFPGGTYGAVSSCFALTETGDLYGWGKNLTGELGDTTVISKSSPVLVAGGFKFQTMIALPNSSNFGVTTEGRLTAWGFNGNGELGLGDVASRSSPVLVAAAIAPGLQAITDTVMISVTPGQTYPVRLGPSQSAFGIHPLGGGPIDYISLEYFM